MKSLFVTSVFLSMDFSNSLTEGSVFSLFYYNNSIPVLPINAVSCVLFILVLWNNDP